MRWIHQPVSPEAVERLAKSAGVSPVVAELLMRAGVGEPAAKAFLNPALAGLSDPLLIRSLDAAAVRLCRAVKERERLTVLGDYDVDGVTSTALFVGIMRRLGLSPSFIVPRRAEDGYGLSRSAIDRALEEGRPGLFVALDCGTNSGAEVAHLRSLGIDVIVVDHHHSKEEPLGEGILINPHADPEAAGAPWLDCCTVGLVFKLMHGLLKRLRGEAMQAAFSVNLKDHLDLVALGTVADLVPLVGENRVFASHGLKAMKSTRRPGLRALMEVSGMRTGQEILPVDLSYRLGPRINASGRLADAALSVELLVSDDLAFCFETARQLDGFNRERQDIERQMTDEAEREVEEKHLSGQGIVLFDEAWHPGVVGIVAGRVSRKYNRPCIVLGSEGELAKGSGRSVDGINLVQVLASCGEHLGSWGGHPMAVGVSLPKPKVGEFRQTFERAVREHTGGEIAEPRLEISAWLQTGRIDESLMEEIEALHPFGQGNPEPVFGIRGVSLRRKPEVFKEQHFRFGVEDERGRRISAVAWKMADRTPPAGASLDMAVKLHWNHFNGNKMLQLELVDWRLAQ